MTGIDLGATLPFRPEVRSATEYVPDWTGLKRSRMIRLDRNESTAPLSRHVADVLTECVQRDGVHGYPDYAELVPAISEYCGVPADFVLPTNGSDEAIDIALRAFLGPGTSLLIAQPEFIIFRNVAQLAGAAVIGVPYSEELAFPYERFREAATARPTVIAFINPNNPTGTAVERQFILEMAQAYPDTPVIVDEAYFEFHGETLADEIAVQPNLILLRTFSKAFAMAGLRIGYVIAHADVVRQIVKVRGPFDVNALAVVAATAQLSRLEEMRAYVHEQMSVIKPALVRYLADLGVTFWPGAANFVLIRPDNCEDVVGGLRTAGILVRKQRSPLLNGTFRMNFGTVAEMDVFMDVFTSLVAARGGLRQE